MTPPANKVYTPFPDKLGGADEMPRLVKPSTYYGLFDDVHADKAWFQRVNWVHVVIIIGTPVIALAGALVTPLRWQTALWAVMYYIFTGMLGITAGYHRHFAHRAYKATPLLRWILMLAGSGAVQGSIRWWCRDHRVHHRYVDTDKDPYSAPKGWWYSHVGWMLLRQDPSRLGKASIADLDADPMITWQHKYYAFIGLFMGYFFPAIIAGLLWGDWAGGFVYAGCLRLFFVAQSTFLINSLCHSHGTATYSESHTARDSTFTSLLTFGEGLHNYHHTFPSDYRNGYRWYHWDPTKWTIWAFAQLGLAYDLVTFPDEEVEKAELQMHGKELAKKAAAFNWGPDPASLPRMTQKQVRRAVDEEGRKLTILNGYVIDYAGFESDHPGGDKILDAYLAEDATDAFCGEVYAHSSAAANLAATKR
eukprot:CAMPEP_0117005684 /NCGR_PEP_ID=MMETSP0472-20121206/6203_1 /TAXON_ID=693140 ORGANISM="Tiarina fusus, Strain LIS" /NCGR_SAMPLE_ID=MMETSP0472 /ASSEMBLY_ACC=CAM_ASM_000603 /LENGTH=419 /DNA_ID=CAMNT_0004706977 /DNA_START=9 /DNA_END=1264 /DNA_ORIENTATION=-